MSLPVVGLAQGETLSSVALVFPGVHFGSLPLLDVVFADILGDKHVHPLLLLAQQITQSTGSGLREDEHVLSEQEGSDVPTHLFLVECGLGDDLVHLLLHQHDFDDAAILAQF